MTSSSKLPLDPCDRGLAILHSYGGMLRFDRRTRGVARYYKSAQTVGSDSARTKHTEA